MYSRKYLQLTQAMSLKSAVGRVYNDNERYFLAVEFGKALQFFYHVISVISGDWLPTVPRGYLQK